MTNIKNLGIKTKEGFEIRNYKTFPSMEWGEDGGMTADIYYKGKMLGNVFQEGNGGCACLHTYGSELSADEEAQSKKDLLTCLKRLDPSYGENTPYSWLKNKNLSNIDDDDYEALVNVLATKRDVFKSIKQQLKTFSVVYAFETKDYKICYLRYTAPNIPIDFPKAYLKSKNIEYTNLEKYTLSTNFKTI